MQKFTSLFFLLFIPFYLLCQTDEEKINKIVQDGIFLHDKHEYLKAIKKYKEAFHIDAKSALAHYELALTYTEMKDYNNAGYHANKVIKQKGDYLIQAYMVKGTILDEKGNTKKSIKLFKKAQEKTDGHYLLNYNLGINYFKLGNLEKASAQFVEAIQRNKVHASSHLYLALAQKRKQDIVPSLLPTFYFLLLEPESERATNAHRLLDDNLHGNVSLDAVDDAQINITVDDDKNNKYASIELLIGLSSAANQTEENKSLSKSDLFINNTRLIMSSLAGLRLPEDDIWTTLYIPFFDRLERSDHFETYCYYILQTKNAKADEWVEGHQTEIEAFFVWLNEG